MQMDLRPFTDAASNRRCERERVDACYPNSGQLADGTVLTTWYSNLFGKFYLALLRYRPEDL